MNNSKHSQNKPRRKSILLVEDNELLQKALVVLLEAEGYEVRRCTKSSEALRMLANQKFDCIVLDMHLELGTGDQIISAIRENKRGFNLRTPILVTSGGLDMDLVKKIAPYVAGILVKPFESHEFFSRVRSLCAQVTETRAQGPQAAFAAAPLGTQ